MLLSLCKYQSTTNLEQLFDNAHEKSVLAGFSRSVYLYFTNELLVIPIDMGVHAINDPRSGTNKNAEINVYPNPFQGAEINIDAIFGIEETKATYSIYSIEGKKVKEGAINTGANRINIDQKLSLGIYFLRILLPSGDLEIHKIIKN